MPQPDNRRERGAKTQTSQRTVAPQGQMPGTISPISGGAAAAAPVLQIGQQAQIQKTGAELYQAIAGVAQGVQQGIKNYDQMYKMVSEAEYAEFETSYIQQKDTVKGDPKKMKAWMDTQTYKPNRVTAKRYWTTRADINQRDYIDDQNDLWIGDLERMAGMSASEKLNYMNETYPTLDEDSPYAMKMQESMIKTSGDVAAETRQLQMNALNLQWRTENTELAATLRQTYPNVSGPQMEAVFAATRLGIVNVDGVTGDITHIKSNQVVTPTSLSTEFIQTITDEIGLYSRPDEAVEAMKAAKLPLGITGGGRTPAQDLGLFPSRLSQGSAISPDALRVTFAANKDNTGKNNLTMLERGLSAITETENPDERLIKLRNLERALDNDPDSEFQDSFDQMFRDRNEGEIVRAEMMDKIRDAKKDALIEKSGNSLVEADLRKDTFTSQADQHQSNRQVLVDLHENAAEMGMDVQLLGISQASNRNRELITITEVLSPEEALEQGNFTPIQLVVSDSSIPDSVPMTFGVTPDGRITYGNKGGALRDASAEDIAKASKFYQTLKDVEILTHPTGEGMATLSPQRIASAFDQLSKANPVEALLALGRIAQPDSFTISSEAQANVLRAMSPQQMAENPKLRGVAGMAVTKFPELIAGVSSDVEKTSYMYGYLAPKDLTPEGYMEWTEQATGVVNNHASSEITTVADNELAYFNDSTPVGILDYQKKLGEQLKAEPDPGKQIDIRKRMIFFAGAEKAWKSKYPDMDFTDAFQKEENGWNASAKTFLIEYTTQASKVGSLLRLGGELRNSGALLDAISEGSMTMVTTPGSVNVDSLSFDGGGTAKETAYELVTSEILGTLDKDKRQMYAKFFEANKEDLRELLTLKPIVRDPGRLVRVDGESSLSFEYNIDYSAWSELPSFKQGDEEIDAKMFFKNLADSEFTGRFAPRLIGKSYTNAEARKNNPTGNAVIAARLEEEGKLQAEEKLREAQAKERAFRQSRNEFTEEEIDVFNRQRSDINSKDTPRFDMDSLGSELSTENQTRRLNKGDLTDREIDSLVDALDLEDKRISLASKTEEEKTEALTELLYADIYSQNDPPGELSDKSIDDLVDALAPRYDEGKKKLRQIIKKALKRLETFTSNAAENYNRMTPREGRYDSVPDTSMDPTVSAGLSRKKR